MKTLVLTLIFATALRAEDAKGPQPIPATEHEAISRTMLIAQDAQLAVQRVQEEAAKAAMEYRKLLLSLQEKYNAKGCDLTLDKSWRCPEGK